MLHLQQTPPALDQLTLSDNLQQADGGSLSPSRTLMKLPPPVCIINPHHPAVAARGSTASTTSATTPTSPRPSATDLTCIPGGPGTLVIGYRGTFAFGRDGLADVKFRKLTRILVHGRVSCFD